MQTNNNLGEFVFELIRAKGDVADEATTHASLLEELNSRIDRALLSALPGDKLDAIEEAIKDNTITEDMVANALEGSDIDAASIISETLENFRDEYLGEAA